MLPSGYSYSMKPHPKKRPPIWEKRRRKADIASGKIAAPKPKTTSWGSVAEWYDKMLKEDTGTFQKELILPNLKRLMAIVPGDRVADLACGQGFFAAAFAEDGAEVVGADLAPELIERARVNAPSATFHVAPAHHVPSIPSAWASQVTVILAIQNIEDVRATFAECARILRPGGRLHVVMNHPAFRIPKRSSWGWDEKERTQYRRTDGYLTESKVPIEMHPGSDPTVRTWTLHRPLQFYVKAFARSGFAVTNLEEWVSHKKSDSGPRAPEENRTRAEFPMFLYLEAKKA